MKLNWKNNLFLYVSILTYLVSLILPVHFIFVNSDEYLGYVYAYVGWMTFPYLDFFCWLGNITLLFSWIFYRKNVSFYVAILTLILMSFYGINHLTRLDILQVHEYDLPLFGYWIWLFSSIFVLIYHYKKYKLKSQTL
ncbi:hypothetical protein [Empedobacter tilapiae]|uniref:Uncharacterized protein n=1 Tax=Empedobacter tilapiae TaxID=2491114 RepID=A0A4Z1B722_9FLAO|nr:hypothetical protein [Empedobacter tilapiae]TGN26268.1 hypothetical protein E4J94_10570 [Empedobacter tilapiae]